MFEMKAQKHLQTINRISTVPSALHSKPIYARSNDFCSGHDTQHHAVLYSVCFELSRSKQHRNPGRAEVFERKAQTHLQTINKFRQCRRHCTQSQFTQHLLLYVAVGLHFWKGGDTRPAKVRFQMPTAENEYPGISQQQRVPWRG